MRQASLFSIGFAPEGAVPETLAVGAQDCDI